MAQAVEARRRRTSAGPVEVDTVRAAGGVVWRTFRGKRQALLVHRPRYDDWSLPKGKLTEGEDEAAAALREVAEEASITCELGADMGTITYTEASTGRPKVVRFWQMQVVSGTAAPANEVDEVRWMSFDEATARLSYLREREVLRRFKPPPEPGRDVTVHLVRHAKAGDRTLWSAPDDGRPLTDPGWRQAEAIAEALADPPPVKLVSSPYLRCAQTLEPLATRLDLAIESAPALAEGGDIDTALAYLLAQARHGNYAASTHGDIMMLGIETLLDQGVRLRGHKVDFKKGSRWELTVRDGVFRSARYRKPPKPPAP